MLLLAVSNLRVRAIEDERNKQVRERSAVLQHEARRDKRVEKKRAEKLITYVYGAVGVSGRYAVGR